MASVLTPTRLLNLSDVILVNSMGGADVNAELDAQPEKFACEYLSRVSAEAVSKNNPMFIEHTGLMKD